MRISALLWIALMLGVNVYVADREIVVERGHGIEPNGQHFTTYDEENVYTFGWPFNIVDEKAPKDFVDRIDRADLINIILNLGIWFWAPATLWFFSNHLQQRAR